MPVVFKKTYTAHEAISLMESISVSDEESSSSDDDDEEGTRFRRNGFIVLQPPRERPDAITDEDSDYEDTGNADRLPRRILNAPAEFSNKSFKTKAKLPSEMTYKISNSNYSDPTTVQTPDAGAQASPIVTAQSSVVEVDPSESTIDSTESCEVRRSKRRLLCSTSTSAASREEKTPGPKKTLKRGRKLSLKTPVGERDCLTASRKRQRPQSKRSKTRATSSSSTSPAPKKAKVRGKSHDSAVMEGYELRETIDSSVPIIDLSNRNQSDCLCEEPLRSCMNIPLEDTGFSDPMKCFEFFFDELIQTITLESNKYAIFRGFKHEIFCESEMRAFIGIIINSMYMKANDRTFYWSRDRDTGIAGVRDLMSRNRFDELMKSLHFRDNREMPADNTDKFYKVRPLFRILNQKLEVFANSENISVDESMIPYFGFHGAKQYMKGKPHKFGYKVWVASSPCGTPLFCEPYAGASTDMPDYGMKKSSDIVAHVITRLGLEAGYKVFADNYFMSPALLKWCTSREIGLTGTLRKNRLKEVPYPPVGSDVGNYKSIVDTKNNIIYTAWQDRKCVLAASNCFSCEPLRTVTVGRGQPKEKSKPELIVRYNENMGGVDLMDFWLSIYRPRIRSRKWYWPLFSWVLGVLLLSSWKLWLSHKPSEKKKENKLCFLSFIRSVNYGIRRDVSEKEHHHQPRELLPGRVLNRFSENAHLVDEDPDKAFVCQSCREVHGVKKRTKYYCIACKVGLHPGTCFRRYHTMDSSS